MENTTPTPSESEKFYGCLNGLIGGFVACFLVILLLCIAFVFLAASFGEAGIWIFIVCLGGLFIYWIFKGKL